MRQIILDTETTGIDPKAGHRIIEIGCVEMINRKLTKNYYHVYINPQRVIEQEAIAVHGLDNKRLANEPLFAQIADDFLRFIQGAELIIHNAPFDVGFINSEFARLKGFTKVDQYCQILDTLQMARAKHPGQKNNLNALCKRYHIDNSNRELHGALLDSELLAQVYLAMTGGQIKIDWENDPSNQQQKSELSTKVQLQGIKTPVIYANQEELKSHQAWLDELLSKGSCLWMSAQQSKNEGGSDKTNTG